MSECRHALHCILPPYILDRLADSDEARVRRLAIDAIAESAAVRATRATLASMGAMAAIPSPRSRKYRLVYDAKNGSFASLPGKLAREEGGRDDVYTGSQDNGGVHINSGIPNHAFCLASLEIGGEAWETTGRIWYRTLLALTAGSDFAEMVERTIQEAGMLFGSRSLEQKAVRGAWKAVGLPA